MGYWDWVGDFNDYVRNGAKDWQKDPLGETAKRLWNYVWEPKAQIVSNGNKTVDYLSDPYPKSEKQFRDQQMFGSIPIVGKWYTDYLRSRNLSDWQAQMRQDYGVTWDDTKYPWLSGLWSANPEATALGGVSNIAMYGGAGAKISKNLKELYAPDKKPTPKKHKKNLMWGHYGF